MYEVLSPLFPHSPLVHLALWACLRLSLPLTAVRALHPAMLTKLLLLLLLPHKERSTLTARERRGRGPSCSFRGSSS